MLLDVQNCWVRCSLLHGLKMTEESCHVQPLSLHFKPPSPLPAVFAGNGQEMSTSARHFSTGAAAWFLSLKPGRRERRVFPLVRPFKADLCALGGEGERSEIAHLVVEHLQLPVALLQLRQLGQELAAEVDVDEAGGAELGHPGLVWTQAAEGVAEGSKAQDTTC